MDDEWLAGAVEAGDLDELVRVVDALCQRREWDSLTELRDRCRRAFERGRQLWPVASLAEYRLALEAPGAYAAAVLVEGAGRFVPGPLAEVAASTHEWRELAPHVAPGPVSALTAHERVVRGEDLTGAGVVAAEVLAVPLRLEPWEPSYSLATYRADRVEAPPPLDPPFAELDLPPAAAVVAVTELEAVEALEAVVRPWASGSDARVRALAVSGDASAAIAALRPAGGVRAAPVTAADALARMAWAGAAGGRHGRRRGAAAGRDAAWVAAAGVAGLDAAEPFDDPGALGESIEELRWFVWSAPDALTGWVLRLAVEDPAAGCAFALDAVDPA